jgi:heme exporter protein D
MARVRVLLGIVVVLATASPVHGAPDADAIDRAGKRVLTDRYQQLPQAEMPAGSSGSTRPPRRRPRSGDEELTGRADRGGGDYSSRPGNAAAGLGTVFQFLVWGAIAVALLLIILAVANEVLRRRREPPAPEAPKGREEEAPKAALVRPLDDAERLAQEGRFAEAIHVLLLRTFQELTRAAGVTIAPSWTSREVLGKIWLAPDAREALVELVHVVELTWFGDDVPGEGDWLRCRAQYDRFVTAYRSAPPRVQKEAA